MNIHYCDRCGKRIEGSNYRRIHSTRMDGWKCVPVTYELCIDCYDEFRKFIGDEKRNESGDM